MRPTLEMAMRAGADILYRELEGTHDFDYAELELPRIARFLERHARDPFPTRIVWEAADTRFGLCRWFAIDRVTIGEPASWHHDHNVALLDDRVTIGFMSDDAYEGKGVKVGNVVEGDYPASRMGLLAGDIIVAGDAERIDDMDDLGEFKAGIDRGDEIELTVLRGGEEVQLRGRVPDPENYYIFSRDKPSALARVTFSRNHVAVQASRVGAFRLLVHPDMVRPDQNLLVTVNGEVVHDAPVIPDIGFLLANFLRNRDRKALWAAEVRIEL
jgi:hypothetical protein